MKNGQKIGKPAPGSARMPAAPRNQGQKTQFGGLGLEKRAQIVAYAAIHNARLAGPAPRRKLAEGRPPL